MQPKTFLFRRMSNCDWMDSMRCFIIIYPERFRARFGWSRCAREMWWLLRFAWRGEIFGECANGKLHVWYTTHRMLTNQLMWDEERQKENRSGAPGMKTHKHFSSKQNRLSSNVYDILDGAEQWECLCFHATANQFGIQCATGEACVQYLYHMIFFVIFVSLLFHRKIENNVEW